MAKGYVSLQDSTIYVSRDGANWTVIGGFIGFQWYALAHNDLMWVAVGVEGFAYSYNGQTWVYSDSIGNDVYTVTWSGLMWVAAGSGGLYASADGVTWEETPTAYLPGTAWINQVGSSGAGDVIAVGSDDGTEALILFSVDGTTWAPVPAPDGWTEIFGVAYANGNYVILGDGKAHSDNLVTWTEDEATNGANRIAAGNDMFIAYGYTGASPYTTTIETSDDAITWTDQDAPDVGIPAALVYGLEWLGAATKSGVPYWFNSADGVTWSSSFADDNVWDIGYGEMPYFVTVDAHIVGTMYFYIQANAVITTETVRILTIAGGDVSVFLSPNTDWRARSVISGSWLATDLDLNPSSLNDYFHDIAYGAGTWFAAAGGSGSLITMDKNPGVWSTQDGVSWTAMAGATDYPNYPNFDYIELVAYGDGNWVIGGQYGLYVSDDQGASWTRTYLDNGADLDFRQIYWDGSQFIAVGRDDNQDPLLLTSPDGVDWDRPTLSGLSADWSLIIGVAYGNGYWVIIGDDSPSTSNRGYAYSTNLTSWSAASFSTTLTCIAFGNGYYAIGGIQGRLFYTTNPASWGSPIVVDSSSTVIDVEYNVNGWVLLKSDKIYITGQDPSTGWTQMYTQSGGPSLYTIASGAAPPSHRFTVNALVVGTITRTFTADAFIEKGIIRANAVIHRKTERTLTVDAHMVLLRSDEIDPTINNYRNRHERSDLHKGTMSSATVAHDEYTKLDEALRAIWDRIVALEE